jgi:NDP-sugar pyrophosphorylase family protein
LQVVILAGGLGTRLRPLTLSTPKCMAKVKDRPFIAYLLEKIKSHRFTRVHICTGYLSHKVKEFVGNGTEFGLQVTYSDEEQPLGTGGTLKNAGKFLDREFLLIQGDTYSAIDLKDLVAHYRANKYKALMVVSDNAEHADIFNANLDAKANLITYYSKNKKEVGGKRTNCVDIGTYVFDRDFLFKFFPSDAAFSLEEIVFPQLIRAYYFHGYRIKEVFYDIGTPDSLDLLEKVLKS